MALSTSVIGALLLAALSSPAKAATKDAPVRFEDLQNDVSRPDDFKRFIEGSREHAGETAEPLAPAPGGAGRGARPLFVQTPSGLRPAAPAQPPAPSRTPAALAVRPQTPPDPARELRLLGMSGALGLGLMLISASLVLDTIFPPAETLEEEILHQAPAAVRRLPEIAVQSSGPSRELLREPFLDTRMPAPTWRAISLPEQKLIEGWDASREKALGLASLPDWIDAHGAAAGVNASLLRAKLYRDA